VALLLAKLYFYLNDYDEALKYALRAPGEFDIKGAKDEFTDILVNKCIERYIQSCQSETKVEEHEQYKTVVDYVVENSLNSGEYKLPLGISLDTKDVVLFCKVFKVAEFNDFVENLLPHLNGLDLCFRSQIL
jgi:26S proteasome regulatory subunit N2